jgi:hypothetical protein
MVAPIKTSTAPAKNRGFIRSNGWWNMIGTRAMTKRTDSC